MQTIRTLESWCNNAVAMIIKTSNSLYGILHITTYYVEKEQERFTYLKCMNTLKLRSASI